MELVPIITYFLLITVVLLLVVLAVSYLFSKSSKEIVNNSNDLKNSNMQIIKSKNKLNSNIELVPSSVHAVHKPNSRNSQIFYINKGRENNLKSFSTQVDYQKRFRNTTELGLSETRFQNKPRYSIVNETYGVAQNYSYNNSGESEINFQTSNYAS